MCGVVVAMMMMLRVADTGPTNRSHVSTVYYVKH